MIKRIKGDLTLSIKGIEQEYQKMKKEIPLKLSNESVNHFLIGFQKGGGQTDAGMWAKRKGERKRDVKLKANRALLVLTGALRKSIMRRPGSNFERTVIGTNGIPYASIHNFGGRGLAYGKNEFTMPKREFIGKSKVLELKLRNIIFKELKKLRYLQKTKK